MNWTELFSALALVMILEGIMPFANPQATRRIFRKLAQIDDAALRTGGMISMVVGLLALYLFRG